MLRLGLSLELRSGLVVEAKPVRLRLGLFLDLRLELGPILWPGSSFELKPMLWLDLRTMMCLRQV